MKKSIELVFLLFISLIPSYAVNGGQNLSFEEEVHELSHRCCICFECYGQETLLVISCGHKACTQCFTLWLEEKDDSRCIFCTKRTQEEEDLAMLQSTKDIISQWKKIVLGTMLSCGFLFILYASLNRWRS